MVVIRGLPILLPGSWKLDFCWSSQKVQLLHLQLHHQLLVRGLFLKPHLLTHLMSVHFTFLLSVKNFAPPSVKMSFCSSSSFLYSIWVICNVISVLGGVSCSSQFYIICRSVKYSLRLWHIHLPAHTDGVIHYLWHSSPPSLFCIPLLLCPFHFLNWLPSSLLMLMLFCLVMLAGRRICFSKRSQQIICKKKKTFQIRPMVVGPRGSWQKGQIITWMKGLVRI